MFVEQRNPQSSVQCRSSHQLTLWQAGGMGRVSHTTQTEIHRHVCAWCGTTNSNKKCNATIRVGGKSSICAAERFLQKDGLMQESCTHPGHLLQTVKSVSSRSMKRKITEKWDKHPLHCFVLPLFNWPFHAKTHTNVWMWFTRITGVSNSVPQGSKIQNTLKVVGPTGINIY